MLRNCLLPNCITFSDYKSIRMSEVDPTTLFGFNPNSPYAKLFVDIYKLTTPNGNQDKPVKVDANMNIKFWDLQHWGEFKVRLGEGNVAKMVGVTDPMERLCLIV